MPCCKVNDYGLRFPFLLELEREKICSICSFPYFLRCLVDNYFSLRYSLGKVSCPKNKGCKDEKQRPDFDEK